MKISFEKNQDETIIHLETLQSCEEILALESRMAEITRHTAGRMIFRLHGPSGECAEVRMISDARNSGTPPLLPYFF